MKFFDELKNLWRLAKITGVKQSGTLVTVLEQEYHILDCSGQGIISLQGFIDLGNLRAGDTVEICLTMAIDEKRINRKITYKGPLAEPIIDFPRREAVNPIVSVKQTTGLSRKIPFLWQWNRL